jgi:hypothetical protein
MQRSSDIKRFDPIPDSPQRLTAAIVMKIAMIKEPFSSALFMTSIVSDFEEKLKFISFTYHTLSNEHF